MLALPSPKKDMRAGNDETDRLHFILGDTVDIQPWNDQFLAFVCESMAPLAVVRQKPSLRAVVLGCAKCELQAIPEWVDASEVPEGVEFADI